MKRIIFIILILIALFYILSANVNLSNEEQEWLSNHRTIRIAPDPDFPPIEWIDETGLYQGISSEFMDLISQELDIEFEVVRCKNWEEVLQKARDREVDMLSAAAQTPQRSEYMDFSSPYLVFPGVIVTRNNYQEIKTIEQLYGKKVVIVSGYVWHEMFSVYHPEIEIVAVNSLLDGLRDVSMGVQDVIIATLPIALYYIEKEGIHNLKVCGETGYFTKLSVHTRKDWPILGTIIQKTLANIPDKTKKDINKKWITIKRKSIFSNRHFWIILISILIVSLFAFFGIYYWNRILRRIIRKRTIELEEDIEKRKKLEENLRESENKYRSLAETSSDIILTLDINGKFTYISPSAEIITGCVCKDFLGRPFAEILAPEYIESTIKNFKKGLTGKKTPLYEVKVLHKDGRRIPVELNASNLFDKEGNIVGRLVVGRDITERKKAEEALKKSEERYQAIFEATGTATMIVNEDTTIDKINKECELITGFSASELVGKSWTKFVHKDDLQMMLDNYRARKKDPDSVPKKYEVKLIDSQKRIRNTILCIEIIPRTKKLVVSMLDITERKRAENALKDSESNLRSLFNSMTDLVFEMDYDGRYLNIAPTSSDLLYKSPKELIGKTLHEVFPKPEADRFHKFIQQCLNDNKTGKIEYSLRIRDKSIWFEGRATPKTKNTVLYIARDITERKKTEEELKKKLNELEIFNDASVGRELMINELRKEINELLKKLGKKPKYDIVL